jgi:N-acylneuraminate cytidylyltransferase
MTGRSIGFIFARGGSKGLPRKNLLPLGGKPLLAHAIETGLRCPSLERIIVSTDDREIAEAARKYGAEAPFLRPAKLAGDDSPEWLAWQHAIRFVEEEAGEELGIFVSLPPTSPLRAVEDVEACIRTLAGSEADMVITVREAERNPYFNMVRLDQDGSARLVVEPEKKVFRRQDAPPVYDMTTVAYAARPEFILNHTAIFQGRVRAVVVPPERALDIDTEIDLKLAELLFRG